MKKPEASFYPVVDFFEVEDYLNSLYGEENEYLIQLFGYPDNDIYKDYLVQEPEKEYVEAEWETEEEWNLRNKFEKYLWEEFSDYKKVILKICW